MEDSSSSALFPVLKIRETPQGRARREAGVPLPYAVAVNGKHKPTIEVERMELLLAIILLFTDFSRALQNKITLLIYQHASTALSP